MGSAWRRERAALLKRSARLRGRDERSRVQSRSTRLAKAAHAPNQMFIAF